LAARITRSAVCGGSNRVRARWQLHRRQIAVVRVDERQQRIGIEVADDDQGRVVGRVPGPVERADVAQRQGPDVGHPADRRPAVGVGGERQRHHLLVEPSVDVVLHALAPLVGDHVALGLDRIVLEHQVGHALALERDAHRQLVRRQAEPVVRPVDPGRGIGLAAGGLDNAIELAGTHAVGLAEHEVLEQVRHPGPTGALVAGANLEPGLQRHHRRGLVDGGQQAQARRPAVSAHLERAADGGVGVERGAGGRWHGRAF
jgi:hypothetical protein